MTTEIKKICRILLILMLILMNIGCDQVSKTIVRQNIDYRENIVLLDNHLTLMKVENTGAFLSLGNTLSVAVRNILFTILPLVGITLGCIVLFTKSTLTIAPVVGFCCVLGGGIGNIFDRIVHGSVTDFLHIGFGIFQIGIFNLADVSIMMGAGIIAVYVFSRRQSLS